VRGAKWSLNTRGNARSLFFLKGILSLNIAVKARMFAVRREKCTRRKQEINRLLSANI
jgi:hypothetical protein